MNTPATLGSAGLNGLASDTRSVDALRAQAGRDPKAAVREVARQFEALFMQELMKSMRQASNSLASGLLDNEGTQLGTEMLDTQYATQMSGRPGGLSEMIARHLERQLGSLPLTDEERSGGAWAAPAPTRQGALRAVQDARLPTTQAAFVEQHEAAAQAVAAQSGIPAAFMIGQAAHESGWGRREILRADGQPSHNLFGIKADASWQGAVAEVTTTEYVDGIPRKLTAKFRAYDSYADSFRDYARLIRGSPRYQQAYEQAASAAGSVQGFARGLQDGGYATDPDYAAKLSRVINTTLQLQRAGN